jgi:ribosome modulation factor
MSDIRNGNALTSLKRAYMAGRKAAMRGTSRESVFYRSPIMEKSWQKGYDGYRKQMKEIKK